MGCVISRVFSASCGCHLGPVLEDGPRLFGFRYCVNSRILAFTDSADVASLAVSCV